MADERRCDGELLAAFAERRDETALAVIVERHAKLVFNVCRGVLGNTQDAEDAAQATFITLSQKAANLMSSPSVAPWLHHVAYSVAVDAHRTRFVRGRREEEAAMMARMKSQSEHLYQEAKPMLAAELDVLPRKYREAIVLFHLEGNSLEQTALALHCPVGTVASRLARGRELLKKRLTRRGVIIPAVALASLLSVEAGATEIPATFVAATVKAASAFMTGQAVAAGGAMISPQVVALTKGALKMLFFAKLKLAALAMVAVTLPVGGMVTYRVLAEEKDVPKAPVGTPPAIEAKPVATFDNSRTLNGSLKIGTNWYRVISVLGESGVLVIRSAERLKHIQDQLTRFGWNRPADDQNPLANVDFSHQTVFGIFYCQCHGDFSKDLKCLSVHGDADAVEIKFVMGCTASRDMKAAATFHFAFVAIPNVKKAKISIATYDLAAKGTPDTAQLEWSGAFDVQRGDWVDGLSASIEPEKAAISVGDDIKLKFTLSFNNANAIKPEWFGQANPSACVWDGKYSNGYANHSFLVERPDGKTVLVRVRPVKGWDKNAPHPVQITPDKPVRSSQLERRRHA